MIATNNCVLDGKYNKLPKQQCFRIIPFINMALTFILPPPPSSSKERHAARESEVFDVFIIYQGNK
jgi:hypothetical protein